MEQSPPMSWQEYKTSRAHRNHLAQHRAMETDFREQGHLNLPVTMQLQNADKKWLTSHTGLLNKDEVIPLQNYKQTSITNLSLK